MNWGYNSYVCWKTMKLIWNWSLLVVLTNFHVPMWFLWFLLPGWWWLGLENPGWQIIDQGNETFTVGCKINDQMLIYKDQVFTNFNKPSSQPSNFMSSTPGLVWWSLAWLLCLSCRSHFSNVILLPLKLVFNFLKPSSRPCFNEIVFQEKRENKVLNQILIFLVPHQNHLESGQRWWCGDIEKLFVEFRGKLFMAGRNLRAR